MQQIKTNNTLVHLIEFLEELKLVSFLCVVKLLENTPHVFTIADHLVKPEKCNLFILGHVKLILCLT